ncbi:MAG: glycosyltransferase family 4 protein [Anaerolineaceae bacterium]|nr:glycosyltransferase family 4 protein [Anaerolineaceae bacterium]
MHILIVADGRSPITQNWINMVNGLGWRISLVSTFPCEKVAGAELAGVLPVGFSALGGGQVSIAGGKGGWKRQAINRFRPLFLSMRAILAPLLLGRYQKRFTKIVDGLKPDVVHALRLPFEGMLAESTPLSIPLVVSIWGNDLTFHARTSPLMAMHTRRTLKRADGLLADASRDVVLARQWGLRESVPTLVVPGNGGLDLEAMRNVLKEKELPFLLPEGRPILINPRGFRPGSVNQDVFFKSLPLVLEKIPAAFFVCTAMQGQPQAERWVDDLKLGEYVLLLPYLPQEQLWRLYSRAQVYVSLSSHDGTPNTFLEALACGCFPVVGDIASLREWLTNGVNGLLVDPREPRKAADAMIKAVTDESLHLSTLKKNYEMIQKRAEISGIRKEFNTFIKLIKKRSN